MTMRQTIMYYRLCCWLLLLALAGPRSAYSDVRLPAMFSDHAVLQRGMAVPVWGWGERGEVGTLTIEGQTKTTNADDSGKWRMTLDPLSAVGPHTLVVEGS